MDMLLNSRQYKNNEEKIHIITKTDAQCSQSNLLYTTFPNYRPNSQDLNHTEHLWGAMKRILKKYKINSKNKLKVIIQKIWECMLRSDLVVAES